MYFVFIKLKKKPFETKLNKNYDYVVVKKKLTLNK